MKTTTEARAAKANLAIKRRAQTWAEAAAEVREYEEETRDAGPEYTEAQLDNMLAAFNAERAMTQGLSPEAWF